MSKANIINEGRKFLNLLWGTVKDKPETSIDWEKEWINHLKNKVEVDIDIPDNDIELVDIREIEKLSLEEFADKIWKESLITEENRKFLSKPYKELLIETIEERYK